MKYSTVEKTGNSAEMAEESENLYQFTKNKTRTYFYERIGGFMDDTFPFAGLVHGMSLLGTPAIFLYYLTTSPFLYKTKEDPKEKLSEIEKISLEK